ncbi:MAG: methionyl-tRNA formyltransferase [Saprospiraceae bacterium]|nr:methionyl-tRNA formyltransferase [Saprospiraceae bacterium]
MKVIFMGSPDFAIPSLEVIFQKHQLLAVVTAPDKPAGRGHQLHATEVKTWAVHRGIKLLQPPNLRAKSFLHEIAALQADILVVVAFRMIPVILMEQTKHGAINLHGSLLPKYRGAAPIQRAIMAGETKTGLTVFQLSKEIDTGKIIRQIEIPLEPHVTGGEVYNQMKILGAGLLIDALESIEKGTVVYTNQTDSDATHAPKIFREDCKLDLTHSCTINYNKIRALIPYPLAWFEWNGLAIKIVEANYNFGSLNSSGEVLFLDQKKLWLACSDGCIELLKLKPEGKKEMTALEFINGSGLHR